MKFKPERSVFTNEGINSDTAMAIIASISKLHSADPKSLITFFLSSIGGSVNDAFTVYDYMDLLKPKLQTVALGEVSSSAIMLFMMGESRYIGKLAMMRFHRFYLTEVNRLTSKNAKKIIMNLERSESIYINILIKQSAGKITRKTANALLDDETVVDAAQAVKLGLAHKIL